MFVRRSGVGTEPGTPSARSSMFTAIQNGFTRPRAAERFPLASHTQPESP